MSEIRELEYEPLPHSDVDMQLLEFQQYMLQEIYAVFSGRPMKRTDAPQQDEDAA